MCCERQATAGEAAEEQEETCGQRDRGRVVEEGVTVARAAAGNRLHVHADAREVYDVSGAGDTVIASMAAMLGAGMTMSDAIMTANRAGGIVVGKLGTATVTRAELFGK